MGLDYDDILEILELVEGSNVEYLEVEIGGTRIVASRSGEAPRPDAATIAAAAPRVPAKASAEDQPTDAPTTRAPGSDGGGIETGEHDGLAIVRAPMVGVFYRRPDPGSPPFVEVGSRVQDGETLGLLEVMKMFTGVTAPMSGEIAAILVEDGAFVEFDEPLFRIRPEGV